MVLLFGTAVVVNIRTDMFEELFGPGFALYSKNVYSVRDATNWQVNQHNDENRRGFTDFAFCVQILMVDTVNMVGFFPLIGGVNIK